MPSHPRNRILLATLAWLCSALCATAPLVADEGQISREHHAWARFLPGSWKLVRIVTENFDAKGELTGTSVTETKTTLKAAGPEGFTLTIESTVELDGKRIVAEPQQISQQYNGALAGQTAEARVLGMEDLPLDGKSYPCQLLQYEINGTGHKSITRTHYCPDVAPYVLRRETTSLDTMSNTVTSRVLVEVQELDVPHKACGQNCLAARVRVEQKHAKGTELTQALSSIQVPGGVLWHESSLVDPAGTRLSRSRLELVDFHVEQKSAQEAHTSTAYPGGIWRNECQPAYRSSRCGLLTRYLSWRRNP